jgi:hypothetical protein
MLEAKNYREFLLAWLKKQEEQKRKLNFSEMSRRAGFSSRSFIQEVLSGKRRLTSRSLPKMIRAFRLTGSEARLFQCLVALEEPDIDIGVRSPEHLTAELEFVRGKLLRRKRVLPSDERVKAAREWAFRHRYVGEVYAALGTLENGASFEEIKDRTGLRRHICEEVLRLLVSKNAAVYERNRFFARDMNLDIFRLGREESFNVLYQEVLAQIQKKSKISMCAEEEFYFHSAYSVRRDRMPEFKAKLKEVLMEFLDEAQDDEGDRVAKLTLALYL